LIASIPFLSIKSRLRRQPSHATPERADEEGRASPILDFSPEADFPKALLYAKI